MPLRGVVHFGERYPNAFWDGQRMVFGDGDGEVLGVMTGSLDVIGHELGHGVTETEAGLEYFGQSGAMNESLSDVWGSLVKQYKNHQDAASADWLIGSEVWTPTIAGDALRSMKAPGTAYDDPLVGKDPQPADMENYVETIQDNGGVHINSGIPNHAFYLAATEIGGYRVGGLGAHLVRGAARPGAAAGLRLRRVRAPDRGRRRAAPGPGQPGGRGREGCLGDCGRPDRAARAAIPNCALS